MTSTLLALSLLAPQQAAVPMVGMKTKAPSREAVSLKLDMVPNRLDRNFNINSMLKTMPNAIPLGKDRPAGLVKEPTYQGTPMYGALRVGNGPRSTIFVAVDEKDGATGRIFVDANANGDLTDDGDGAWPTKSENQGVVGYQGDFKVRASWGDPIHETESGDYSLTMYRREGDPRLNFVRSAGRVGKAEFGGKSYDVVLVDNQADAVYTVPRAGDRTRKPVWLLIDVKANGKYRAFDLAEPFELDGAMWEAYPTVSGAEMMVGPSDAKVPVAVAPKVLKKEGQMAPDFTVETPDGRPMKLSDFRGKTVILDFWATWCGPCQASMPGLEKIYKGVKDQNVVVLSVNVFDAKKPFDAWIKANSGTKYSFTFGYDPAERDQAKSVAGATYGVAGIPTMFIIDKNGKIASVLIGSGNEKGIVDALAKLGVKATA